MASSKPTNDLLSLERVAQELANQILKQTSIVSEMGPDWGHQPEDELPLLRRVSLGAARNTLERLEKAAARVEDARHDARLAHWQRTRHLLQGLRLLDLPNEVLLQIMHFFNEAFVRWSFEGPSCPELSLSFESRQLSTSRDLKSIQNLRLVCRQLCTLSSPLLLPTLLIETSPASIAKLLEISRNTLIAQGVQIVKLRTSAPYDSARAQFFDEFASDCRGSQDVGREKIVG